MNAVAAKRIRKKELKRKNKDMLAYI